MKNLENETRRIIDERWERRVFRGTVTGTSGNRVAIKRSEHDPEEGPYPRLASYSSPTVGDEVIVKWVGGKDGGYIIEGKVLR